MNKAGLIDCKGKLFDGAELSGNVATKFNIQEKEFQSQGSDKKRARSIPEINIGVNELYQCGDFGLFLRMLPYMGFNLIKQDLDVLLKILKKHID